MSTDILIFQASKLPSILQIGRLMPDGLNSSFSVTLTLPIWQTPLKWPDTYAKALEQQTKIGGLTTDQALASARGTNDENAFIY
jgi:hypothetical protein